MAGAISELGLETEFPIPEFVMVYGLFVVLMTEQIVVQYQERGQGPALAGECGGSENFSPISKCV